MNDNELLNIDERKLKKMDNLIEILKQFKKLSKSDLKTTHKDNALNTKIKQIEIINMEEFLKNHHNIKENNDKRNELYLENQILKKRKSDLNKKLKLLKLEYIKKIHEKKEEEILKTKIKLENDQKAMLLKLEEIKISKTKERKIEELMSENEDENIEELFIIQNLTRSQFSYEINGIFRMECKLKRHLEIKNSVYLNLIIILQNTIERKRHFNLSIEQDNTMEILIKNYLSNKINFVLEKNEYHQIKILLKPKKITFNIPKLFVEISDNQEMVLFKKIFLPCLINHFILVSKTQLINENWNQNFVCNKISQIVNKLKFDKNISYFRIFFPINEKFFCKYLNFFCFQIKGTFFPENNLYELEFFLPYEFSFYFESLKNQYSFFLKIVLQ